MQELLELVDRVIQVLQLDPELGLALKVSVAAYQAYLQRTVVTGYVTLNAVHLAVLDGAISTTNRTRAQEHDPSE